MTSHSCLLIQLFNRFNSPFHRLLNISHLNSYVSSLCYSYCLKNHYNFNSIWGRTVKKDDHLETLMNERKALIRNIPFSSKFNSFWIRFYLVVGLHIPKDLHSAHISAQCDHDWFFSIKMLGKYFVFGFPLHIFKAITGYRAGSEHNVFQINAFYWYHLSITTDL